MYLTFPISYPVAKLLDKVLGEHKLTRYNNKQLEAIIKLNSDKALAQAQKEGHLDSVITSEDKLGIQSF